MQKIIFVRMRKVYLLTTAHLEDHLWFREEEDFRVGMNYVAIESAFFAGGVPKFGTPHTPPWGKLQKNVIFVVCARCSYCF